MSRHRALRAAFLVFFPALWGCSLLTPRVASEDWLALGFRTPEQAFRTFQTALAADLPMLEYRCLSGGMKAERGISALTYLEAREELFDEMPWLRLAARAEIEEVLGLDERHRRIVARIDWFLAHERFSVDVVREDYFELWSGGDLLDDGSHPFRILPRERDGERVAIDLSLPWSDAVDPAQVTLVRAGGEWKIDGFARITDPEP